MSFPERRYEFQCACDPIFGIQPPLGVIDPNALVLIIPNIGSRCGSWVNHQHIAFQKTTCPSGNFLYPGAIVNYFWDGTLAYHFAIGRYDLKCRNRFGHPGLPDKNLRQGTGNKMGVVL